MQSSFIPDDNAIAIVGVGCRFPGEINSISDLWQTVINKRDAISEFKEDRFNSLKNIVSAKRTIGKIVSNKGGFLQDVAYFDADFFAISAKEAEKIDPQQRLLLETSFNAIEDAGIALEHLYGSNTGVFVGCWTNDYEHRIANIEHDVDVYSTTGTGRYAMAGRLSFFYNLQGPSFAIDTACSSSLVAVHLAIQSLQNRECDMALAAAANTIIDKFISVGYSRSGLLSEYGGCYFGTKNPNGYVRSEGAATVVLKRLKDAIHDNNPIYAVIKSSACNNDGTSGRHMLSPSTYTQQKLMELACKKANIEPNKIGYVEAHGTGTKAGDISETLAISNALNKNRTTKIPIGSIKSNIGHTEAVAGFAGLFKAIMAIKNQTIPPNIHFYEPNPKIDFEQLNIEIATTPKPWQKNEDNQLIAGVNSFGVTGTNAFVIIENFENEKTTSIAEQPYKILPISAQNNKAINEYIDTYNTLLTESEYENSIKNIAFHKANLDVRNAIIFSNFQELKHELNQLKNNIDSINSCKGTVSNKTPKIAFVFPGQGSQWIGMGKQLYQHNLIFKTTLDACEKAYAKYVNWQLTHVLFSENDIALNDIAVIQPTITAIQIALATLWQHYGIEPYAVLGHSMGEVAAAYIANCITLDEAANIICNRSSLMQTKSGLGAMGYIGLPSSEVAMYLQNQQLPIDIGVVNSPKSTVITGNKTTVEQIVQHYERQGVFSRLIQVDVASHSNHMDSIKEALHEKLVTIQPQQERYKFQSSVLASYTDGKTLNADYWLKNLRNTVLFADAVQNLIDDGIDIFIEISPNPVLINAIQENIEFKNATATIISSLEKNKDDNWVMAQKLAIAFCNGVYINWKHFYGTEYKKIQLPEYPWQKEWHWLEGNTVGSTNPSRMIDGQLAHPFLEQYVVTNENTITHIWQSTISTLKFPFLNGHKIADAIIFPAAAYLEILHACCVEINNIASYTAEDVTIKNALQLNEESAIAIKITLQQEIGNLYNFTIHSIQDNIENEHFSAQVTLLKETNSSEDNLNQHKEYQNKIAKNTHYEMCVKSGLHYSDAFIIVEEIGIEQDHYSAQLNLNLDYYEERFYNHPALLDGCLQACLAPIYQTSSNTYIPYQFKNYKVSHALSNTASVSIRLQHLDKHLAELTMAVFNNGKLCIEANGIIFKPLEQDISENNQSLYHELTTIPITPTSAPEKNPILIIHNNVLSETIYKEYQQQLYEVSFLEISDYSKQSFVAAISNNKVAIKNNTQLLFCIDTPIDWEDNNIVLTSQEHTTLAISALVQAIIEQQLQVRLWCLIQNGISINNDDFINPIAAQIPAFIRVLWNENNELKPSVLSLNTNDLTILPKIIYQSNKENELVISPNLIAATRLNIISKDLIIGNTTTEETANTTPFHIALKNIGVIDNLFAEAVSLSSISNEEVLIEVATLGINFMNLLSVLGVCPGKENGFGSLGIECVGIAKKVGSSISHIQVGDIVYGMGYHTMATHVAVKGSLLCKCPDGFTTKELATIPTVFLTVYYSLVELARIKKGDKVLIHAATGGVGLAAIQICKLYECEIFATAGSENKRTYLSSLGIDNIYDSRSTSFYEEILEDTNGKGVDVVLNSLVGEALYKSLTLLTDFGRFIEIGKKDIYNNSRIGLEVFKKSLSYFMVDLDKMVFERPEILGELLQEITYLLQEQKIQPLPYHDFNITQVKEAFNKLNTSQHIGKIVINFDHKEQATIVQQNTFKCHQDASYILSGGYGGLGLSFTKLLIQNGATHILLLGRSLPNSTAQQKINQWINDGIDIQVKQVDVSNYTQLANILTQIPEDFPLKGIFHLAGLLEDSAIINLTTEQYYKVIQPKISGAIHLHLLSKKYNLDYFVLFSSSTVLFASPGQAAYVSANAFLDALATERKRMNLPAQSIQWSTISDVGLAATQHNRSRRLEEEGIQPLTAKECTTTFANIANNSRANIGVFSFDIERWQNTYTTAQNNPYFSLLIKDNQPEHNQQTFIEQLSVLSDGSQIEQQIEDKLKETISKVTKVSNDKITGTSTFKSLGIDSLMSIQLKNQLEKTFDTQLSVTAFWTYATIKAYTQFLIDKLKSVQTASSSTVKNEEPINDEGIMLSTIESSINFQEELSELDDLSKLLDEELNSL